MSERPIDRPVIALNADLKREGSACRLELGSAYPGAIQRAGGVPFILPAVSEGALDALLARADGLVLVGGDDYHPALYGEAPHPALEAMPEERQRFDLALARRALERGMPILAICGGCQLINLVLGGSLIQDVPSQVGAQIVHRSERGWDARHEVEVARGSWLERILGRRASVNSWHHQAIGRLGRGVTAVARAGDGVIEAITVADQRFCHGVQWHPEEMADDPAQRALFGALVQAAAAERPVPQ